MLADDLLKAQICERDGLVYAVGLSGGQAWLNLTVIRSARRSLSHAPVSGSVARLSAW